MALPHVEALLKTPTQRPLAPEAAHPAPLTAVPDLLPGALSAIGFHIREALDTAELLLETMPDMRSLREDPAVAADDAEAVEWILAELADIDATVHGLVARNHDRAARAMAGRFGARFRSGDDVGSGREGGIPVQACAAG